MKNTASSNWNLLPLSGSGIKYFSSKLIAERGLASQLVAIVSKGGLVDAYVPSGTVLERALEFDTGGFTSAVTSDPFFPDRVQSLLSVDQKRLFVIQDLWAVESDANKELQQCFTSEGCVYYFCDHRSTSADVSIALRQPLSFKILAGVFAPGSRPTLGSTPASFIDALANSIVELYLNAYDGESFLVWRPQA